jgi:hypothetical protein
MTHDKLSFSHPGKSILALDKSPLSHIIQHNYIHKDCEEDE